MVKISLVLLALFRDKMSNIIINVRTLVLAFLWQNTIIVVRQLILEELVLLVLEVLMMLAFLHDWMVVTDLRDDFFVIYIV